MGRSRFALLLACVALLMLGGFAKAPGHSAALKMQLDALVESYPDFLAGHDADSLIWKDGAKMPLFREHGQRTAQEIIEDPDIADIFAWAYPVGAGDAPPPDFDPGRARPHDFFVKMYGDCRAKDVANLATVDWVDGTEITFTPVNGADKQLALIARDLKALGPQFAPYLTSIGGTYNCRNIAGTDRQSMHSFGAAIDINTEFSDYWRWAGKGAVYRNRIPLEIVRVFEKHGFIWGGRWAHFDTGHFEYRPEIILAATRG